MKPHKGQSPPYPGISLQESLPRLRAFDTAVGARRVTKLEAYAALGYSSKSGTSVRALNALLQYGLLTRDDGSIRMSDLGARVLAGDDPDARNEAGWNPAAFNAIRDRAGTGGVDFDGARATLTSLGYTESAVSAVFTAYRETYYFVGDRRKGGVPDPGMHGRSHGTLLPLYDYLLESGAKVTITVTGGDAPMRDVMGAVAAWVQAKRDELDGA